MRKLFSLLLVILMLTGCAAMRKSAIQYVEVPRIEKEYIARTDTTIVRDSVYVDRYQKADTVFLTKYKEKFVTKIKTDTLSRIDTMTVVKEVKVPEKYVPDYYHRVSTGFWVLLVILLGLAGWKIYKIFKKV